MRAYLQRSGRGLLLASLIFSSIAAPSIADNINQQVASAEDDLTQATQDVLEAQKSLADAQKRLPAARTALYWATKEEEVARGKYNSAAANLSDAKAQLKDANDAVVAIQAKISDLQQKVDLFARSVYQQGEASQWEIVLQAESPTDLSSRLEAIKSVSRATARSLADLNSAKADLKVQVDRAKDLTDKMQGLANEAAQTLAQAQAAADRAASAKASVDALVAQEANALDVAKQFKAKTKHRYDVLRAEQIRIQNLSNNGSHGSGDPQATGPLDWPMPGYAAGGGVGPRINPYTGQQGCHTGQDIAAPSGTPIHAAASGIVFYAGWSVAYGNVTLIDHGDGLMTMYAHQSRFALNKGAGVVAGDVIGYVGSTGYSTGPHLHFEVHINGKNYDPMGWFGRSKSVVSCAPTRGI
jgi:murein DD-endopeptidase MepM/ murein hydrolase activator NlpD